MSSMIISDECLNRIVDALVKAESLYVPSRSEAVVEVLDGVTTTSRGKLVIQADALGKALYDVNEAAYCERYAQHEVGQPESIVYRHKRTSLSMLDEQQLLKVLFRDLGFLLYQCAEGSVYESLRYNAIEELQRCVAVSLAKVLTDNMQWG